jgi:DnaK suppressor protein
VKTEQYKRELLAKKQELLQRLKQSGANARQPEPDVPIDVGDKSIDDEEKGEQFEEAGTDWKILEQVQDALKRIDDGTFGKCLVDGGPIEKKRLKTIPWAPYCAKHQALLEKAASLKTPSL